MVKNMQNKGNTSNLQGSVTIRIEELLAGKSFEELSFIADKVAEFYADNFYERLSVMMEAYEQMPPAETTPEYAEYVETLQKIGSKPVEQFTEEERLFFFRKYKDSLDRRIGPLEHYHGVWIEDNYTESDVINDKSIFTAILDRLPKMLIAPEKLELRRKIEHLTAEMQKIMDYSVFQYSLSVNKDVFFKKYDEIVAILTSIKKKGFSFEIVLDNNGAKTEKADFATRAPYSLSSEQYRKINDFKQRNLANNIYFSEFFEESFFPINRENLWSYQDVVNANWVILNFAKRVKQNDLSPCEKIYLINRHLQRSKYMGVASNDERTRTFLTSYDARFPEREKEMTSKGRAFVCTGYASCGKALIDAFEDENMKAFLVPVRFYSRKSNRKKFGSSHMIILVYINDEKYGKKGYYIFDPTWSLSSLEFVLLPVNDYDKLKKSFVNIDSDEHIKIVKYLKEPREDNLPPEKTRNIITEKYGSQSEPFTLDEVYNILVNLYSTMKDSSTYYDYDIKINDPEELAAKHITDTFKEKVMFDEETATNAYYKELRDYFLKHLGEFGDWKEKWTDYAKNYNFRQKS